MTVHGYMMKTTVQSRVELLPCWDWGWWGYQRSSAGTRPSVWLWVWLGWMVRGSWTALSPPLWSQSVGRAEQHGPVWRVLLEAIVGWRGAQTGC